MHNITKIKIFRVLLWITWLPSLLILYPLAALRKKRPSGLFFFFDRYVLGGAQKVHLDILTSVKDLDKTVFFTRKSADNSMFLRFKAVPNAVLQDIHFWCDNLLLRLFSVHYFAFYVNRHDRVRVLSSNSTFFYDMLPFIKRKSLTVELLHNFSYGDRGMEYFGLLNCHYLSVRTTIDTHTRNQILAQYAQFGIDSHFADRVRTIEFGVEIPGPEAKPPVPPLVIAYAGRGGPQKRIWLINRIAERCRDLHPKVLFRFAGTFENELSEPVKASAELFGIISDDKGMADFFSHAHVLLMTSSYEGFPVVIKECLANGCIPVVPALEGIKTHLTHGENGLLIPDPEDENAVVEQAIILINTLLMDPALRTTLSENARIYAKLHFSKQHFIDAYRLILS